MTKEEKAVIKLLQKIGKITEKFHQAKSNVEKELKEARLVLGNFCSHPKEYVKEYNWEHDNGYGMQTMQQGLHCKLCGRKNPWSTMSWPRY